jgi:hypothetical protein
MSTVAVHDHEVAHHDEHGHEHHHNETFVSKYIFSMDHKMIAKQFLITGITMAVIAMILSILFRIQLAYPDKAFPFNWKLIRSFCTKRSYRSQLLPVVGNHTRYHHGILCVNSRLKRYFSNLLIPLQIGARDMASPFMNMLSYWFFFTGQCDHVILILCTKRPCRRWLDNLSATIGPAKSNAGFGDGYDALVNQYGVVRGIIINGWYQLRKYRIKHAYKRYGPLENAFNYLGFLPYRYIRYPCIPCTCCRCCIVDI